jgi:putative PIN family toxin of toxin-antitoxin system
MPRRVVLDTNVIVAALRSRRGASYRLLSLLGKDRFEVSISVALVLEYEDVLLRQRSETGMTGQDVEDFLDYVCAAAGQQEIFFLWRPCLRDPKDDMVLELAVAARCDGIVTFNLADFRGIERFGLRALTPRDFLFEIGELS